MNINKSKNNLNVSAKRHTYKMYCKPIVIKSGRLFQKKRDSVLSRFHFLR